jgi:predicted 2-oxoglutarate/Fe(II)-dependent dioxygenase YbiX
MSEGHGVGIHTDVPRPGEETHRIVVLLARDWNQARGGHFVLLHDNDSSSEKAIIPMASNSAIAFRLTERSFHAVTIVTGGQRFSLVASFRSNQL